MKKQPNIHWIPDEEYQKARGQLRLQFLAVLSVFDKHGFADYIPPACDELLRLAEDFSLRVRGIDKPISLELIRRKRK